jgi:glycosyltransferase involved in cell wall biosynthesis
MGKKHANKSTHAKSNNPTSKHYPFVSICTPTFNRRPFIHSAIECIRNQTYPKNRMEWIIVDDGTDKIQDIIRQQEDSLAPLSIKYVMLDKKAPLGKKRNISHENSKGSILVYMDDDDYYPPERVQHAVETLQANPQAMCAGSSEIYIYFKHVQKMYQFGPYGPNHATAGTFAFRRELLKTTEYKDDAALAEERAFLNNYTTPFVQLDPLKTILVFSHIHNTFDKKTLLGNPNDPMVKESPRTVDEFIRKPSEAGLKEFFLEKIELELQKYEPGHPRHKPDVLKQMEVMKREREEMMRNSGGMQGTPQIIVQKPGEAPRALNPNEIVQHMQGMQLEIQMLQQQLQSGAGAGSQSPIPQIIIQKPGESPRPLLPDELVQHIQGMQAEIQNLQQQLQSAQNIIQMQQNEIKRLTSGNP